MSLQYLLRSACSVSRSRPIPARNLHCSRPLYDYNVKYAEKLKRLAQEKGISVEKLKEEAAKSRIRPAPIPESKTFASKRDTPSPQSTVGNNKDGAPRSPRVRKDNSPVKPLHEIINVRKILSTPHTAEQISALWNVFHASRSLGTGRGYLSATVPVETYAKMAGRAEKWPSFILPLPRSDTSSTESVKDGAGDSGAYEFYFLQWAFHPPPQLPPPTILDSPSLAHPPVPVPQPTMPLSTVLLTPLLEYKTRRTFATPHLVLTHYTDLAASHGVVLLRGELTALPSSGGGGGGVGRYWLSQQEAQVLALGLQRFYLTDGTGAPSERAELLRVFNECPSEFKWEELLKHADPTSP